MARRLYDDHHHLVSRLSDSNRCGQRDLGKLLNGAFQSYRRHGAIRCADHVDQAPFNPETSILIEVTDITGAVPAGIARGLPLHRPQLVIPIHDVASTHADFAGCLGNIGECAICLTGYRQWTQRDLHTR